MRPRDAGARARARWLPTTAFTRCFAPCGSRALIEAVHWIAGRGRGRPREGRAPKAAELFGKAEIAGVSCTARSTASTSLRDGSLAIIDYKTGKAPSAKAVAEGFALQLGLLALIAERGGFEGIRGTASAFEYWSLAKDKERFGKRVAADKAVESGHVPGAVLRAFRGGRGQISDRRASRSSPSCIPALRALWRL